MRGKGKKSDSSPFVEPRSNDFGGVNLHDPILGIITTEIGKYRLLDKSETNDLFFYLDEQYEEAISVLINHTRYADVKLLELVSIVMSGAAGGRVLHYVPREERKDPTWGHNRRFLLKAMDFLHKRTIGSNVEKFDKMFRSLNLTGSTLITLIDHYLYHGFKYLRFSRRFAIAKSSGSSLKVRHNSYSISKILHTDIDSIAFVTRSLQAIRSRIETVQRFIYLHHLRLLIKVASSLTTETGDRSTQILDNFQAGSFGLMRSIRDHRPPYPFIGYASSWIRQSVMGAMRGTSSNIKIPLNVVHEHGNFEKAWHQLVAADPDKHYENKHQAIAEHLGINPQRVTQVYSTVDISHTYSLDKKIKIQDDGGQESSSTLRDIIVDNTDHIEDKQDVINKVRDSLSHLSPKERWVVCNYFGAFDHLHYDDSPEAEESIKSERIRQLLSRSIRRNKQSNKL